MDGGVRGAGHENVISSIIGEISIYPNSELIICMFSNNIFYTGNSNSVGPAKLRKVAKVKTLGS